VPNLSSNGESVDIVCVFVLVLFLF
jgi:hypothetical protein